MGARIKVELACDGVNGINCQAQGTGYIYWNRTGRTGRQIAGTLSSEINFPDGWTEDYSNDYDFTTYSILCPECTKRSREGLF